jgi:hypothetical protein
MDTPHKYSDFIFSRLPVFKYIVKIPLDNFVAFSRAETAPKALNH